MRRLWSWGRIGVSLLLLALVAARLDWREAGGALKRLEPAVIIGCVALALVGYTGRAMRWTWLLRRAGVRITHAASYRLTLVGLFYGMVTPGRMGELGRVWHMDLPRARTLPSVVWDRLADILLLELLSIPALAALGAARGALLGGWLALVAVTLAGMLALDSARATSWLTRRVPRLAPHLADWHAGATGVLWSMTFLRGLLAGLFFYAFNFAGAWLLLHRLAPGHAASLALLFPVIILLGNLPIAFGGLGLREQVAALTFARLGASASIGPVFSLLWFLTVTALPAVLGLLLAPTPWGRVRAEVEPKPAAAPAAGSRGE